MSRYETGDALPYEWSEPVYGDVRHHRARIEQLKEWVRDWKARSDRFESENRRLADKVEAFKEQNGRFAETNATLRGENRSLRATNAVLRSKVKAGPVAPLSFWELEEVAAVLHDDTAAYEWDPLNPLYRDLPEVAKVNPREDARLIVDRVLYILNNRDEG